MHSHERLLVVNVVCKHKEMIFVKLEKIQSKASEVSFSEEDEASIKNLYLIKATDHKGLCESFLGKNEAEGSSPFRR